MAPPLLLLGWNHVSFLRLHKQGWAVKECVWSCRSRPGRLLFRFWLLEDNLFLGIPYTAAFALTVTHIGLRSLLIRNSLFGRQLIRVRGASNCTYSGGQYESEQSTATVVRDSTATSWQKRCKRGRRALSKPRQGTKLNVTTQRYQRWNTLQRHPHFAFDLTLAMDTHICIWRVKFYAVMYTFFLT